MPDMEVKIPEQSDQSARKRTSISQLHLKTGEYLEQNLKNVKVLYTRKTDVFMELRDRAEFANKNKADLFISIHANWKFKKD